MKCGSNKRENLPKTIINVNYKEFLMLCISSSKRRCETIHKLIVSDELVCQSESQEKQDDLMKLN